MCIAENYERIQDGIADACAASGRRTEDITLIAVTKFVPIERIAPALELGVRHVGENRAQELVQKLDFFKSRLCDIHFIGQLQTNKVKYIIGQVGLVQSVDRIQLVQELERQAAHLDVVQDILVQVNIGHEVQKGGIDEGNLVSFLESMQDMPHIRVKGLMCVPPALDEEEAKPYFARMRTLFEQCKSIPGVAMQHLSMGMSGDYKVAIREGATMVRVGSALFGART
jgi:pyridoxal phosphate enzyme (YggS family)